jgi:cobalt/nickel transport protein
MSTQPNLANIAVEDSRFFDGFTKTMLLILLSLFLIIFASGKYMSSHHMGAGGTDDAVNNLASAASHREHHPFIELPGDAEVAAFSVGNFFCGLIVGYHWLKLFGSKAQKPVKKLEDS